MRIWCRGNGMMVAARWFGQAAASPLIAPEASRWHNGDQFVEVEIDDRLQCVDGSALLKVFGQSLEPLRVLTLQDDEFGDGIAPALGAAASVGRWLVMAARCRACRSALVSGLSPRGLRGMGSLRSVT